MCPQLLHALSPQLKRELSDTNSCCCSGGHGGSEARVRAKAVRAEAAASEGCCGTRWRCWLCSRSGWESASRLRTRACAASRSARSLSTHSRSQLKRRLWRSGSGDGQKVDSASSSKDTSLSSMRVPAGEDTESSSHCRVPTRAARATRARRSSSKSAATLDCKCKSFSPAAMACRAAVARDATAALARAAAAHSSASRCRSCDRSSVQAPSALSARRACCMSPAQVCCVASCARRLASSASWWLRRACCDSASVALRALASTRAACSCVSSTL
mmetsp:Transcript_11970/g.27612  ORF Transcript_11970/g.27612 Transcript_11970/m.27612 type:complete len:274 (+) Transcript_11970:1124-1945(+)